MLRSNVQAEISVLSTLANTTNKTKQSRLMSSLRPEYFGTDATREIFDRIKHVADEADAIPSFRVMRKDAALSDAAKALIKGSGSIVLRSEELDATMLQVREIYSIRVVADAHELLGKKLTSSKKFDVEGVERLLEDALFAMRNPEGSAGDMLHGGTGDNKAADMLVSILKGDNMKNRVKTGWGTFDTKTGGFSRGDLVVITANFGGGKSVAAISMFKSMHNMGHATALATLEMDNKEVLERLASNISRVEYGKLRLNQTSKQDKKTVSRTFERFDSIDARWTFYAPSSEVTIKDIFRTLSPYKYDVIFIDYIGLLKHLSNNKNMREDQLLGESARFCKIMASKLNCVIVLLAQLNDEGKVFGARAITHHASFWFKWTMAEEDKQRGFVNVEQGKARGAECYDFYLTTDFAHMTMADYTGPVDESQKKADKEKNNGGGDPKFRKQKQGLPEKKTSVKMSLLED